MSTARSTILHVAERGFIAEGKPSPQPDTALLNRLFYVKRTILAGVALIAGGNLLLWFVGTAGLFGPAMGPKMLAYTALVLLLSTASFYLSAENRSARTVLASQIMAAAVLIFGLLTLIEYASGLSLGFDTWLPHASGSSFPGRPEPQTDIAFALLGSSLLLVRESKGIAARCSDALFVLLSIDVFVLIGAYMYGAIDLLRLDPATGSSPQTVICLGGLTFCIAGRRAACGGFLSVLVDVGMGGQAVRALLPLLIALPFASFGLVAHWINAGMLQPSLASAIMAACESFVMSCVVVWLVKRINTLEHDLRSMSLTDEMTGVYNHRGFNLLGEQAMREARRSGNKLTVFYFDLDGLKRANDTYGHDIGSQFIVDVAELLRMHFRDADIVARVGGDEFAVVTHSPDARVALERIADGARALNQATTRRYPVSYSVGEAVCEPASGETFVQVVARADAKMYEQKQAKRAASRVRPGP